MRLLSVLLLIALAVAGWTGYWFFAANQVETAIDDWLAEQRKQGAEISHGGLAVSGYPFRLRVAMIAPRAALPNHPATPRWQAIQLSAVSHPWTPRHVILDLSGVHELTARVRGEVRTWRLETPNALASWSGTAGGGLERLSVDVQDVLLHEDTVERLKAVRVQAHLRPLPNRVDGYDFAMDMRDAVVSWTLPSALAPDLKRARAHVSLNGPIPNAATPSEAAAVWRDAGGTIDVRSLALTWGKLDLTGEGTVTLDEAMRPMGALTTQVLGYEILLNAARDDGQLSDGAARAAKTVLRLLAAANGGTLSVPVRLQDGEAYLGPVLIARLGPLLPAP